MNVNGHAGHAPMHQPASPRINGAGRGRYNTHRGGGPAYHYQPVPAHHMPPPVSVQTPPPLSPASPYNHQQKFTPHPHPHHQVPYGSPYHHPQPNGPYPHGWQGQALSPLPKQLPTLSPMLPPQHIPQLHQPQPPQLPPLPPLDPHHLPLPPPVEVISDASPMKSSPVSGVTEQSLPQPVPLPVEEPTAHVETEAPLQSPEPSQELLEDPTTEDGPEVAIPRSPSPAPISFNALNSSFVIWSRRPGDPSLAPGIIISNRAFPPEDVVQKALDLPSPPASPKPRRAALLRASNAVMTDTEESSSEPSGAPSSSTTETTPAGSLAADTPVPGSPYSCATSVSAAVDPPPKPVVPDHTEAKAEPAATDVAVETTEPSTPQPANAPAPTVVAPPAPIPSTKPPPGPKKSWASLLHSDTAASSSKSRLPVSNVVGFSVPATAGHAPAPVPGVSVATANRNELLHLLNEGPSGSAAHTAASMKIRPRGLVNTGNMCFANAVLQVLVYCPPFHRFFSELRRHLTGPVVGSQREGTKATPLVDATIQFLKEFVPDPPAPVESSSKSKGKEREDDSFDVLDSFIPSYVYDAMKEKKRFASMIVIIFPFSSTSRANPITTGRTSGRRRRVPRILPGHS